MDVSREHGLIAVGTEDGTVECFDSRTREAVGTLRVTKAGHEGLGQGVTALKHDPTGMHLAAGDHDGIVRLYDLRSSRPLLEKDHMYGSPIVDVKYHTAVDGTRRVMSTDKRVVKFWDPSSGANYTAIEPGQEINDVRVGRHRSDGAGARESHPGVLLRAPSLGAAPRWCSFLENLTEEMEEEKAGNAYDDYRFVTREELERLGMTNLIGTKMLRAYMHGFFVDNRLYGKAKAIAEPFSYEDYRAEGGGEAGGGARDTHHGQEEAPEGERRARRAPRARGRGGPRAGSRREEKRRDGGAGAATRRDEESDGEDAADADEREGGLLKDDRFAAMFKDSAFEVDEESETYRMLHPNAPKLTKREREEMLEEHFDLESDGDDDHEHDANGEAEAADAADAEARRAARRRSAAVAKVKMYAAKDERHAAAFREGRRDVSSTLTLAERAAQQASSAGKKTRVSGNKELRFEAGERGGRESVRARSRGGDLGGDGPDGLAEQTWTESGRGEKKPKRRGMGGVLPGGGRGGKGGRGGGRGKRR